MELVSSIRLQSFCGALERHKLSVFDKMNAANLERRTSDVSQLIDQFVDDGVLFFHKPEFLQVMNKERLQRGVEVLLGQWEIADESPSPLPKGMIVGQLEVLSTDVGVDWRFLDQSGLRRGEGEAAYLNIDSGDHLKVYDSHGSIIFDDIVLRDVDYSFIDYGVDIAPKERAVWCQIGFTTKEWGEMFFAARKAVLTKRSKLGSDIDMALLEKAGIYEASLSTSTFLGSSVGIGINRDVDSLDYSNFKKRKTQSYSSPLFDEAYRKINELYSSEGRTDYVWFIASRPFGSKPTATLYQLPDQSEFDLLVSDVVFPKTFSSTEQLAIFNRAKPKLRWFKFVFAGEFYYGAIAKLENKGC